MLTCYGLLIVTIGSLMCLQACVIIPKTPVIVIKHKPIIYPNVLETLPEMSPEPTKSKKKLKAPKK